MSGKKKALPGTWVTREIYTSEAFWALSGTAKGLLLLFLGKRDMSKKREVLNQKNITLTYLELENLFGNDAFGKPRGLSRASIPRGIKDLMEKGFIEIVRQGGGYQKDKTIYGLTDDWKWWQPGTVVRQKQKGKAAARNTVENNFNPHNRTHTHPHNLTLNGEFRVPE